MTSNFFIVPGVLTPPREIDLTLGPKPFSKSIGGAIIVSRKGDEENKYVTRPEVFDARYGAPDPTWSFDHYCIRTFLRKGEGIWLNRITRNARHAGSIVFNDRAGSQGSQTFFKAFNSGRFENYKNGRQQVLNFKFSAALVTTNTVSVEFSDNAEGNDPQTVTQVFTDTNDKTLENLAAAITASLNTSYLTSGKASGYAFVNKVGANATDDRVLTIVAPEDVNLFVTDVSVTGGSTQATATMFENSLLLEVYAANRGRWGDDVGYRFANASNGINQKLQISFSQPLVANQQINLRLFTRSSITNIEKDTTVNPEVFDTNHLTTVQNFVSHVKAELGTGGDAYIVDGSNGLQVVIVSPTDGPNTISIPSIDVTNATGNAALPAVSVIELMAGINNDQTFDVEIYTRSNLNVPVEIRTVSLVRQVDGNGQQTYIEDVINNDSSSRSEYIRVKYNTDNSAGVLNIPAAGTPIYWLKGGDDGVLPTTGDIVLAWDNFKSRQKTPMRILINCGHSAVAVHQKMTNIAKNRFDCIAILDFPSDKQEAQAAYTYRNAALNVDSSYSTFYSPDILQLDEFSNTEIFVPPSGHVAAQYAETDSVAAEWFAPAGLNRAILDTALGLREEYDEDQMALLISAQINPIINRNGTIVIWDQLTTQRKPSAFRNVSLRRMLITVEVSIVDGLDYTIHEPNDDYTAVLMIQICITVLQPIKEGRGLNDYAVVSDDRNNKDYDYNMQQRNLDVIMDPILPIRTVRLSSVVTKRGTAFTEVITAINGGSSSLGA